MTTSAAAGPGIDLRRAVGRSQRRHMATMMALMAPSVLFVAVLFVVPIALFMFRSIDNSELRGALPHTVAAIGAWGPGELPDEPVYAALVEDLRALKGAPAAALLGRRLNYAVPGYRGLITKTVRSLPDGDVAAKGGPSNKDALVAIDEKWGDPAFLAVLRQQAGRLTDFYLLAALDLERSPAGDVQGVSRDRAVFVDLYGRTLLISLGVTVLCLLIGYPVAAVMASAGPGMANLLLMLVLVPFWTSLLVRSTAWVILLQNEGVVNKTLIALGLADHPLPLAYNRTGVLIAMVHVLLPYMILPLYSVMKSISPVHLRAAASLGATPATVFRTVYLPLTAPGIAAGATLVFVLSIGFYVTPALVGGPGDQMIGYFIAYFTNSAVNWGLAASLGTLLLLIVALIYLALGRLVGLDRLRVR
jgi:putative spermidine/putrescine transport system permease protein